VFAVSTLSWDNVVNGGMLAFVLLLARFAVKTVGVAAFSQLSGIPWRKGVATGTALAPMSVFVVLLLEQTKNSGVVLVDELATVAAMTVFMEVLGPIITQRALIWARETPKEE
jgi:Kef-type K+ transport system membrane component KefB